MELQFLYNYLLEEERLSEADAIFAIQNIKDFDPDIRDSFLQWIQTRECMLTVEGISPDFLMNQKKMSPLRAFKMLDWLKREPEVASMYLKTLGRTRPLF